MSATDNDTRALQSWLEDEQAENEQVKKRLREMHDSSPLTYLINGLEHQERYFVITYRPGHGWQIAVEAEEGGEFVFNGQTVGETATHALKSIGNPSWWPGEVFS